MVLVWNTLKEAGVSVRKVSVEFGTDRMTLTRIIKKGEKALPSYRKAMVFNVDNEKELADYLVKASQLNHGYVLNQI